MKIQYASDLHLEFDSRPLRRNHIQGDVLVLAGDIAGNPRELSSYLKSLSPGGKTPIVYVMGNHELYGLDWTIGPKNYRHALNRECGGFVHFLEKDSCVIGGVRFLGTSLWTDFLGETQGEASEKEMNDFKFIKNGERSLRWSDVVLRYRESLDWLSEALSQPFDGPTVVVTHTAPSFISSPGGFGDSEIRGAFCNDLDDLVRSFHPSLWIHGHLHNTCDYRIESCRVVCNPYGYESLRDTNLDWDPLAMVEIMNNDHLTASS